jgi:hypothetical protein
VRWDSLAIATITWARDPDEERLLRAALRRLCAYGRPIATVVAPEGAGLVAQTRASLKAALELSGAFLLYTEPDKLDFFETVLPAFVAEVPQTERLGAAIAARTAASFATYPQTQRLAETAINALFAREVELDADFCYGPLVLNRALIPLLNRLDPGLGWGWRFAVLGAAQRAGYRLHAIEADLPCPPAQRADHVAERVHRMRQLGQNLQGVIRVLQTPDPG